MSDTQKTNRPAARQKVPDFARYEGTSCWRKDKRRVRAYAWFKAWEKKKLAAGA